VGIRAKLCNHEEAGRAQFNQHWATTEDAIVHVLTSLFLPASLEGSTQLFGEVHSSQPSLHNGITQIPSKRTPFIAPLAQCDASSDKVVPCIVLSGGVP